MHEGKLVVGVLVMPRKRGGAWVLRRVLPHMKMSMLDVSMPCSRVHACMRVRP